MATDALTEIFTSMQWRLKSLALRFTSTPQDADDALQEAFCSLWSKRTTIEPEGASRAYMSRSVINAAIDLRRANRMTIVDSEVASEIAQTPDDSQDDSVDTSEVLTRLAGIIDSELPPLQRQIMKLHDIEGLDNEEISQLLSIPQANVRANLARARSKAREIYHNLYSHL